MATLEEIKEQLSMLNGSDKLFCGGEIKSLPKLIANDEHIAYAVTGHSWGSNGLFVATDKRLLFVDKQLFGVKTKEFPYNSITTIESDSGLALGKIVVRTAGGKFTIKGVQKKHVDLFIEIVRGAISRSGENSVLHESDDATLTQLERLAKLREQGVLTEEEFLEEKRKILAQR